MSANARHNLSLKEKLSYFHSIGEETDAKLKNNPFSDQFSEEKHRKGQQTYGRPPSGTKTEARGIKAGNHVYNEIIQLCEIIDHCGYERPDGLKIVRFEKLFGMYTRISDKVVGMLLRARKHGLVDFEGEMLYQRQDEHKIITLLKPLSEIRETFLPSNDPYRCGVAAGKSEEESTEDGTTEEEDAAKSESDCVTLESE